MSTHNSSSPRTPLNHNYNHPRQSVGSAVADRQTFRRSSTEPPEGFITANALHQAFFSQQGPEAASANASGMPSVAGSAAGSGPGWVPGLLGAMRAAGGSVRSSVRSSHNDGPRGYSSVHPESKDASDERCSEGAMDEEDYTAVLEDLKLEAGATNTDGGGSTGRALAPRVSQSTAKDSSRHGLTQPGTTANPSGNSVIGSNRRGMLAHTLGRLLSSSPGQTRKHLQREEALMAARRSLESGALVSQAGGDGPTTPRRLGKQWSQGKRVLMLLHAVLHISRLISVISASLLLARWVGAYARSSEVSLREQW